MKEKKILILAPIQKQKKIGVMIGSLLRITVVQKVP